MGELIINVSELLGMWDVSLVTLLFVITWAVLRNTGVEIAMILAYAFDLAVPLQYHSESSLFDNHKVLIVSYR